MANPLSSALLPKLQGRFPGRPFTSDQDKQGVVVFPCEHPDVGDVEIRDDGDEVTVVLGNFTHTHIGCYDEGVTDSERVERICDSVIYLLEDLFADRIELYGSHVGAGGFRRRDENRRGLISKGISGTKSFVWSGPLSDSE